MVRTRWLVLNVLAVGLVCGAPREYGVDELITKPRPGEEFVHIQTTSKTGKVDLLENSFATSHRNPELSKSGGGFETAHKSSSNLGERSTRSIPGSSDTWKPIVGTETRVSYSIFDGSTTNEPETIVTRTSIKMSKSKKVQKSVARSSDLREPKVFVTGEEGFVDETANADEEELKIIRKKFSGNEGLVERSNSEDLLPPLRLNVPLEDEVKQVDYDYRQLLVPNPVLATTQEPPITTFNYKKMNEKLQKDREFVAGRTENELKSNEKIGRVTIGEGESIRVAESKAIEGRKKEGKRGGKEVADGKEESGYYVLPVNKQSVEENFDFVDADEKVLVPAGSSPGQSSRINVKKGPNGQDYEYEYVYYYYDDDEDGGNGSGSTAKEGKAVSSSTEKVYNGHDGPAKDERRPSFIGTSTSGNKYLPTEAPKSSFKPGKKSRGEEAEAIKNETPVQNVITKNSRSGNRFSPSAANNGKQTETANNEVLPTSSGRSNFRPRGRSTASTTTATTEEIGSIGEERLPSNTRFPPRSRGSNVQATLPQPQETTARHRNREGGSSSSSQSRLRIPNSSLLDSSSFRTHSSDASVEDDSRYDAEHQRRGSFRGQSSESSNRRGPRPTAGPTENGEVAEGEKRFANRKTADDKRSKLPEEGDEEKEEEEEVVEKEEEEVVKKRRPKVPVEDDEKLPKVPFEESLRTKVLEEEGGHRRLPGVPLEDEENAGGSDSEESPKQETVGQRQHNDNSSEEQGKESSRAEESAEERGSGNAEEISTRHGTDQSDKDKGVDSTTEDQSAVGLTSAMMEKVALDLYAILQQTQNENIRTNFVDGNATEVTTEILNETPTEYSTFGDGFAVETSTAATTTTTTTVATTTTTTTTPAPTTTATTTTQAAGRGRYRGRGGSGGKVRSKVATTTTAEPPEEVTSPKTRGRFHGAGRGSNAYGRKPPKTTAAVKETASEDAGSEEIAKSAPERSFGERPRNRFRGSPKVSAVSPTTAAPSASSQATAAVAARGTTGDRFHGRRRGGGRGNLPTSQHSAGEESGEEVQQDSSRGSSEEATSPATAATRPTRPRIGGSVRPLRPGPRAPLVPPQRGHGNTASTTTSVPAEHESVEKEVAEPEGHNSEESQETSTLPPGDALTKLRNRPRLRIGAAGSHQKPQAPSPTPPGNRRKLVSSLLPKRKPSEEKQQVQKVADEAEEKTAEEVPAEEPAGEDEEGKSQVRDEPSTATTESEPKGLSGLLAGRRRNLNRRPGTLFSRPQQTDS